MAETIAEVFIRLGTSGVGDAQKKLEGVEKSLVDLGHTAKVAFAAMNPAVVDGIISKQNALKNSFDAGSITIHEYVAGLREINREANVLSASFSRRESMAQGLLKSFGIGPDAKREAEDLQRTLRELFVAGNLDRPQVSEILKRQRIQSRGERAMAYSDAESGAEVAKTQRLMRLHEEAASREVEVRREAAAAIKQINADVARQENADRLRSIELTRQFETEQERFNRRLAEYNSLHQSGRISKETHGRAVAHLNATLDHNNNLLATGKKNTGMAGVGFQQLSYAVQDFVQVADQGLGRALQASANNLGVVIPLLVKSASLGAGLAIGFTALATAVTMWERSSKKASDETERLNKSLGGLDEILRKIAESQKNVTDMRDLLSGGSASALEAAARSKGREASVASQQAQAAGREQANIAAGITAEATAGLSRGNILDEFVREELRKKLVERNVAALTKAAGQSGAPDTETVRRQIQITAEQGADREIAAIKDKVFASKEYIEATEAEMKASAESTRLTREKKAAQDAHVEAVNQEIYALQREEREKRRAADAAERFEAASGRRSAMASIERGIMSDPMQRAMAVFDDFQKNVETIAGGGGGPAEIAAAGGLFQNQLDALVKDNKPQFRPGMAGFSEFGQQFQQALFQDPAEKDRKEQLRLQREANEYAKQTAESLAGGLVSGPALFGGGGGN